MAALPGFNALAGAGRGAARVNLPQPKPPKTIIGQALAGHPNWATPNASGNVGGAGGALLGAGGLSKPPGAPPQAAGQTPGTSATQTPSPLDAQYYANVNQNQFSTNQKIAGLNQQGGFADTALQQALAQLAYQQPRDQLTLEQNANRNGSLYSTAYTQGQGNLVHQYTQRQTAAQTAHDQKAAAIQSAIQGLLAGIPIYNEGQATLAAQRAIAAAANPATGQPAAVQPPAATPPSIQPGSAPAGSPPGKGKTILQQTKAAHPSWFPKGR